MVASSSSSTSFYSLPPDSDSSMNVSSVIVPPKVPPRQRRGSDSAPCSPKLGSPLKKKQITIGGVGVKPGSPKIEALKNDPFNPPPSLTTSSPPKPPPRGRFLKKGGQTQSCADIMQSCKKPRVSKSISEEESTNASNSKDDMFMSKEMKNDQTLEKEKDKKSGNFFILQPNSSSLMTTIINEDTPAVSNDKTKCDQTDKQSVPCDKEPFSINNGETIKNNQHDKKGKNTSDIPIQNDTRHMNSSSDDKENDNKKNEIHNMKDNSKHNSQDANLVSREPKINELATKEENLKENGCLENKIIQQEKSDADKMKENNDKAAEKIEIKSDSSIKSKLTSIPNEESDNHKGLKASDNLIAKDDAKSKSKDSKENKDTLISPTSTDGVKSSDKTNLKIDNKLRNNDKLETRSVSSNELKKTSEKVSPSPSTNATSKKQGMFDVVGNFSAISDVLPSVSSVTKSLTTASTNIDGVMGASKLSKVVKFDISSKVILYEN